MAQSFFLLYRHPMNFLTNSPLDIRLMLPMARQVQILLPRLPMEPLEIQILGILVASSHLDYNFGAPDSLYSSILVLLVA
jgi:hypothetical protein